LYEILIKTFKDRDIWQIGIVKLAEKLTLEKHYPSQILEKLQPAINEINKNTELKINLDYNKETHICTFTNTKVKPIDSGSSKDNLQETKLPEDETFKALTSLLPTEHQGKKTILESIASSYKKHGFDYTARNIKYTNRHSKGNYRVYLNKALKEDWGLAIKEDEESKKKIIKEQQVKNQQEQETLKQQRELHCQVKEYMKTLSPEELETLREEAIGQLNEKTQKNAKKIGNFEFLVRIGMEEIVGEQLKSAQCG
jgi:hypothetical protein